MPEEHHPTINRYALVGAGFFMSCLACLDGVGELLCVRFSVLFYLVLGAVGIGVGNKTRRLLQNRRRLKIFFKGIAFVVCLGGISSAAMLSFYGANWDTKCSWRYCGRALGIGLLKSPFPVGSPSCRMIHLCANEYRMSSRESAALKRLVKETGCPAP